MSIILSVGCALPEKSITQTAVAQQSKAWCCTTPRQERTLDMVYKQTQINTRSSVLIEDGVDGPQLGFYQSPEIAGERGPGTAERMQRYRKEARPLALEACRRAIVSANVSAQEFTQIVTVSCTGFAAPGIDYELIEDLKLPRGIGRTNVGFMGCHGAMNGLRVARAYCAEPGARVLLCTVEICSLHLHYGWDGQKIISNALFADGAAAVVLTHAPDASRATGWRVAACGSTIFPDTLDAMSWHVGDHGFEMTLSSEVPDLIAANLGPWLKEWLAQQKVDLADVATWAVHPGGPRIVDGVQAGLKLPPEAVQISREVLAQYGNMSSPTVLFILERLMEKNAPLPCVAMAFGPGLTAEVALIVADRR